MPPEPQRLSTGAEMRVTNPLGDRAVVCVNGGQGGDVEGTWSASIEWLAHRLAPEMKQLAFAEVRFRIKSWNRLGMCVEDALSALSAVRTAGAQRSLLLGFSMGGAVAIGAAGHPSVSTVVGLAPWIPSGSTSQAWRAAVWPSSTARSTATCSGSPA